MNLTKHDILNILHTNRPVSIIRSGDGEGLVLKSQDSLQSYRTCIDNVMKRQMGYEPTHTDTMLVRDNLIKAYHGADVVGVPMHSNLADLGKHWNEVQSTVEPFCISDKRCSTDVFYDLLYDGSLTEWLRNKPVVNYISCRNLDAGLHSIGVQQVNSFTIAPEAKFTSGYDGEVHYPTQFNRIGRWMSKCAIEDTPCLVGAGVIGKIYCNWFRDLGGIAIDAGAVMDLLAGFRTRGAQRGIDAIDNRWKL